HAQAHPGQNLPALPAYGDVIAGGQIRYAYRSQIIGTTAPAPTEEECLASPLVLAFPTSVPARFENTCRITTATDLDFGAVAALPGSRDQASLIQLQCPTGTAWRVGLDNGSHALGTTRRMAGPNGNHLRYELYRDPQRTQRW